MLQGGLWAAIAPGVRYQVFANQSWSPLPTETQHMFVAFALFAVPGLFIGVRWRWSAGRSWTPVVP